MKSFQELSWEFYSENKAKNKVINQRFFFHQPMHKWIVLKTILKFTLKQLQHISVQLHHHQGAYYMFLLELQLLK